MTDANNNDSLDPEEPDDSSDSKTGKPFDDSSNHSSEGESNERRDEMNDDSDSEDPYDGESSHFEVCSDSEIESDPVPAHLQDRIMEICSAFMAASNDGECPDRSQWERRHPELNPHLGRRLRFCVDVIRGVQNNPIHDVPSSESESTQGHAETFNKVDDGDSSDAKATLLPEEPDSLRFVVCPKCGKVNLVGSLQVVKATCTLCREEFVVASSEEATRDETCPKRIGRLYVVEIAGRGTFGTVYHAFDPIFQQSRAVKLPHCNLLTLAEIEERIIAEARSAARLRHPNFVQVLEIGHQDGVPFLVMEYIDGKTLEQVLWAKKKLPQSEAVDLMCEISLAMDYAHSRDVIHRDLKPANVILMETNGRPVLIDYGLARHGDRELTVNEHGDIIGSPAYMSPEQATGDLHLICPASDVYSLAVMLFRMLTGKLPFLGGRDETIRMVVEDAPPMPSLLEPSISAELEAVILKAMSKRIEDRFASAAEFAEAIRPFGRSDESAT